MSDSMMFVIFVVFGVSMLFADCEQTKWRHFHVYKECLGRGLDPDVCSDVAKKGER